MIKTTIEFNCTWEKEKVQKLFDKLINASGITELGLSMVFIPDEDKETPKASNSWDSEKYEHPAEDPNFAPIKETEDSITIPHGLQTTPKMVTAVRYEPVKPLPETVIFTEIERISGKDLGQVMGTTKPILTYAETKDGRVTIFYNESPMYTTFETVRALPEKIPAEMVSHLSGGKRACLRGFKQWLKAQDALEEEAESKYPHGVDPYAPILTGGAKVDTHARGKIGDVS